MKRSSLMLAAALLALALLVIPTLTADQRAKFRDFTMPEVKKIIVEKYSPEGEAMMKAFLDAIDAASK
jgi:hypothetical protein